MNVIVYTSSTCGDCRLLKNWLDEKKVVYEEKNIDGDRAAHQTLLRNTGGKRVIPVLDVAGRILVNPEFSQAAEALGLSR